MPALLVILSGIQWSEPLILRFNGQEYRIFVDVDYNNIKARIEGPFSSDAIDYIKVCATLPIRPSEFQDSIIM